MSIDDCKGCVHIMGSKNYLELSKACAEFFIDMEKGGYNYNSHTSYIKRCMSRKYITEDGKPKIEEAENEFMED